MFTLVCGRSELSRYAHGVFTGNGSIATSGFARAPALFSCMCLIDIGGTCTCLRIQKYQFAKDQSINNDSFLSD